jgi:hypothetical protein
MPLAAVTSEQILDALQRVPAERWGKVLQVIEDLETSHATAKSLKAPFVKGIDLRNSDLIGIWADRNDLGPDREFADKLRRQAEQREHQ